MTVPQIFDPQTGKVCLTKRTIIALAIGAIVGVKSKNIGWALVGTLASAQAMEFLDFPADQPIAPVAGVGPADVFQAIGGAVQQAISNSQQQQGGG